MMVDDPTCLKMKVQPQENKEEAEDGSLKNKTDESSVKAVFLKFASSTTAHGISNFATSPVWTAKVSWFLIWLSVMTGFIFMIVQLTILYQSKPVSTNVKVSYEKVLKFPGVTICNLNIVRRSSSSDFFKNNLTFGTNSSDKGDLYRSTFAKESIDGLDSSKIEADDAAVKTETILQNINRLPESEKIRKGYPFESFIIHCVWSGIRCDRGNFKQLYWVRQWNWKYGNCYTFNGFTMVNNTKVYPLNVSSSIDKLLLTIDIQAREYQPMLTTEVGIRVLIQDQDFVILPDKMGVSIPPGASASISIRKQQIITEDVHNNGSCRGVIDDGSVHYSLQACQRYCEHLKEVEICSCSSLENVWISKSNLCQTLKQERCSLAVRNNFTGNVYNCDSICPVPCSDVIYDQTITQGKIFPNGYKAIYGQKNQTELYISENIVQLSVYYGTKAVETIDTKASYKFENLISDVGGQLGLWIGVSAVTCIEFITLMWNVIMVLMRRKRAKQSSF